MVTSDPIRRLLQQTVLAELGLRAIGAERPEALIHYTVQAVADAVGVPLVAVFGMEEDRVVLQAGVGWPPGERSVILPASESHLGASLASSEPIAIEEDVPGPLSKLGVVAGLSVRLGGAGEPVGVLGAYAYEPRVFDDEARTFLGAVAAVLAGALEQARTEQALRETEARARAVLETTVDGVITIDEVGLVESFNPAAERIFGYTAAEVIGKNVHVLMPEPYRTEHDGYIQAYHDTGRQKIIGIGREVMGRRKDGSTFPLDLAVSEVRLDGRRIFTGLVRDISERRTLEQEILRIAEEERRRIGQDLHDGLGQMLTGTSLIARGVARQIARGELPTPEDMEEVVSLIKQSDAYARNLARGLVPVELEAGGLAAALERLATNAEHFFGVKCVIEVTGERTDDPPKAVPTHLFRIAQEAVTNAVRHGRAERITITLARGPEQTRLRIQDDGHGLAATLRTGGLETPGERRAEGGGGDAEAERLGRVSAPVRPDDNRGMGVRIMHYRARVLGGRLEIRPGTERGTVVTCTVPHVGSAPTDAQASS